LVLLFRSRTTSCDLVAWQVLSVSDLAIFVAQPPSAVFRLCVFSHPPGPFLSGMRPVHTPSMHMWHRRPRRCFFRSRRCRRFRRSRLSRAAQNRRATNCHRERAA
jgi:hypothetical protein